MSTGIGSNPVDRRMRRRQTEDYLHRVRFMYMAGLLLIFSLLQLFSYLWWFVFCSYDRVWLIDVSVSSAVSDSSELTLGLPVFISPNIPIRCLSNYRVTKFSQSFFRVYTAFDDLNGYAGHCCYFWFTLSVFDLPFLSSSRRLSLPFKWKNTCTLSRGPIKARSIT